MPNNIIPFGGKSSQEIVELNLEKEVLDTVKEVLDSLEKEPYEHAIILLGNCGQMPRIMTSPMLPETATSMLADAQWALALLKHTEQL